MTMWTFWAATECEPAATAIVVNRAVRHEQDRDAAEVAQALDVLRARLPVLEEGLQRAGPPVDYSRWDFYQSLTAARQAGKLNVACLGIGVDPLSLAVDILTVAVFDGDTFDAAFGDLVTANAEGRVVSEHDATGIPFTSEAVTRFAEGGEPMQAAGAAVLSLAWRHRANLLG